MGSTSYSSSDWDRYAARSASKSTAEIYTNRSGMVDELNPAKITVREARDSTVNPVTTPVIAFCDFTGSMGELARQIATKGMGQIFQELLDRKVVPGPQFAMGGYGDVAADEDAWLQVSQFESDTASLVPQIEKLYRIGQGGGGNAHESENLAWYFAMTRIAHDAYSKRGEKGFLFTIGDEEVPANLTVSQVQRVFGDTPQSVPDNAGLLAALSQQWEVFHIMVEQGSHMRSYRDRVVRQWTDLLGQRAILLSDISKLSEVIVSTIQVVRGTDADTVVKSWSGDTSLVVAKAVSGLGSLAVRAGDSGAVTRF